MKPYKRLSYTWGWRVSNYRIWAWVGVWLTEKAFSKTSEAFNPGFKVFQEMMTYWSITTEEGVTLQQFGHHLFFPYRPIHGIPGGDKNCVI